MLAGSIVAVNQAEVVRLGERVGSLDQDAHDATGREGARELHFALEALVILRPGALREQELHRRRPAQERVLGSVHRAHPALADELAERVLAELSRLRDLASQAVD